MNIKALLTKVVNDGHVPIALVVFTATTVFHFYTRIDLGQNYVDSIKFFYLFLAGHAATYQKWPDKDQGSQS